MDQIVQQEVSKQLLRRFFVQILLYAFCTLLIFAVGYWFCNQKIWYSWEMLYPIVHTLHVYWVNFFLFFLLFGCVVISCVHFCRIARMMGLVTQAVDDVYTNRVNLIALPPALQEVEKQLNEVMMNVKESHQAQREAEQRKNDMIVYMAHDLKTPLTSVIGYLTLLKDEPEISAALQEKYLGIALNKANRLEELVNEFFEVTRFHFASMELNYSTVNMTRMLEQILYEFRPLFMEKGMEYRLTLAPDLMVSCDVDQMERVLDNLIKNAINYSYEQSELLVSLEKRGEYGMTLMVRNQGKTIPKEKLEHLFEQFFRLDSARSSKTGGSGLGLAIARQIIELHHGTIRCKSENETVTFWVEL